MGLGRGTSVTRRCAITVSDIGEFGLIRRVTDRLGTGPAVLVGPGDDAAVLRADDGRTVASTDLLIEGRHFRRDWCSAQDVGHKAAAQNFADIAAMGAAPTALLVGLACPADLPLAWVDGLTDGLREECATANAGVVGGDVSRSDILVLAITALGDLQGREPVTRAGARPGDVVAYTGRLGWAAGGLTVLGRGFRSPLSVVGAYRRPAPPYQEGPRAAQHGATAMIDVSDGLVQDLGHVATASGVGIELDSAAFEIPDKLRDVGQALGFDPLEWILTGGEDHALVATFPARTGPPDGWRVIGRVVAGDAVLVDGREHPGRGGYDHFAGQPGAARQAAT